MNRFLNTYWKSWVVYLEEFKWSNYSQIFVQNWSDSQSEFCNFWSDSQITYCKYKLYAFYLIWAS